MDEDGPSTSAIVRRVELVPMRDGVKLKTIILVPRGATNVPMLLTRTPYNDRAPTRPSCGRRRAAAVCTNATGSRCATT